MPMEFTLAGAAGIKALAAAKAAAAAAKLAAANALGLAKNAQMAFTEAKLAESNLQRYVYGSPISTMPHVFLPSANPPPGPQAGGASGTWGSPMSNMFRPSGNSQQMGQPMNPVQASLDEVWLAISSLIFGTPKCSISNFL